MLSPTPLDAGSLEPGQIFGQRYRLVHELRSTSASVVWRADDLVLQAPVAVEIIRMTATAERERVLHNIRTAHEFTHPAVCRVFGAGEAEGRIYCSLELVNGQSLRHLARRAGRLPAEKVADIGRQLCRGLAALNAAGLRGGIDGSTILLDLSGSVRIADLGFGLPERDRPPTAGSWDPDDALAVGTLLYELLVGAPADRVTRRKTGPARPSTLVHDVDPRLERTILDALDDDPRKRPASAAAMAAALTPLPGAPQEGAVGWMAAVGAVALVTAALALLATWLVPKAPVPLTDHDTIVLADFTNTTGNPVFDGALKVALAVALEQSPFLRIFPDDRARDTLRLMQRSPDERITSALAREIAQRERLKALVAGSIDFAAGRYVVSLEAIEASTGEVMAREQVAIAAEEEVLRALGSTAARLRGQLGESLASVQRFDAPLPQATTASLEALHAYWLAHDQGRLTPRVEAIPHLQRAIELDPGFAMALAALSGVYRNTDRSTESPEFSRRAFDLRDRVSERERFFISWRYYVDAAQAWDKALELSASWTRTYPREAFAFNSFGLASAAFGDHEQAVRAFREAIRLDPGFAPPHGNLAGSLIASNRYAEAKMQLADANERGIGFITLRRMGYLLAFIEGDRDAMMRELDLVRKSPDAAWALIWEARTLAFEEQTRAAHDLFQRGARNAAGSGARELAGQWTIEDAEVHAIAGECGLARSEARSALELSRDSFTLERAGRTLALCGDSEGVAQITGELRTRFPEATLTARIQLPVIAAAGALQRGDSARAIELLEPVAPYDQAPSAEFWPTYLRGEAHLRMNDGRSAAREFRGILARRGQAATSALYPLARRRLAAAEAVGPEARSAGTTGTHRQLR